MMPVAFKGLLYLVGAVGFWSLAYEAGKKKGERDRATSVEGVAALPSCDPYLTLPTGNPDVMRIVRPHDADWCIALGYHLQLAACARANALSSIGRFSLV